MRVMLIDESRIRRNIQRNVLRDMGHTEIMEAGDGHDALSKVDAFKPDLILCHGHLPTMDGLTFVRTFRSRSWSSRTGTPPIIMVSPEVERARVLEAIRAGVSNYLVEPFTPESLVRRVEETLSRARAA